MERLNRQHLAYVGVDVHKEQHMAMVLGSFGDRLGSIGVANRTPAFGPWLETIRSLAPGKQLVFGLENTSTWGRTLARYLLEQGQIVRDVAPIRTDRGRKRQPHPDKSDERDALAIGKALLQDLSELPATAHDELLWTLSLAVTQREGMVREQTRVKNRLHALLPHVYPDYQSYFSEPFGKTALAFWSQYPSAQALHGVCVKELGTFLRAESHYALGWAKAEAILSSVTTAPAGRPHQAERDVLLQQALNQCRQLQQSVGQVEQQIERLVRAVGTAVVSIPGVDVVTAAELLVGIGDVNRFATPDKLARYAGIAPKEWSSAGKGNRTRSDHGRRSLHTVFFRLAVNHVSLNKKGIPICPESRAYYEKKLHEGKSKKAALTCLMRALVRVVWRILKDGEPYWKKKAA